MCKVMESTYPGLNVTDIGNAAKGKSTAEVTKMWVDTASYILRASVGGTGSSKKADKRAASSTKPLWNVKQLAVGQHFSCISYLRVDAIDGDKVTVKNQLGGAWFISKDLLERDCWSGDHYDKEVKCTMKQLAEVLDSSRDTIFKVGFKKKLDAKNVEDKLATMKMADLKNDKSLKELSKSLVEGDTCELTAHLISADNSLGRSTVIDLNSPAGKNFR